MHGMIRYGSNTLQCMIAYAYDMCRICTCWRRQERELSSASWSNLAGSASFVPRRRVTNSLMGPLNLPMD